MRSYSRAERLQELIKEEVSYIIRERVKDPRIGFLTILRVTVSRDFSVAKIYVSIYGDKEVQDKTMEALNNAKGFIRGELGNRIRLKFLPELIFIQDDSEEFRFKLDAILKEGK